MNDALALAQDLREQLSATIAELEEYKQQYYAIQGVSEQWADIAQHSQDAGDRLERERDDALALVESLRQQLLNAIAEAEEYRQNYHTAQQSYRAAQEERDTLREERDEALHQNTQLLEHLAAVQQQMAATRPSKTVMQLNAELEAQLLAKDKEIEDILRQYRSMAENLKRERDSLRQQLETGAPGAGLDLVALARERDRILSQTRSDKLKAVKTALDQFLKFLQD